MWDFSECVIVIVVIGSSMHASRSIGAMKRALLMSKMAMSSSSPSAPGTLSLTRSPNNTLKISHGGIALKSSCASKVHLVFQQVCISPLACLGLPCLSHNPPDRHNCFASSLCFCSADLEESPISFTQRTSSIFPVRTSSPGSCALGWLHSP